MFGSSASSAGEEMPASVQAELVARVASYDKNLKGRAGPRVTIVIAVKQGDVSSERSAAQLAGAFARIEPIGGLPHETSQVTYTTARALADTCKARRAAIVFVTDALAPEVENVRAAFDGVDALTIGASGEMSRRGLVLGIELVSSRPKLFVNLSQASKQNVVMSANVLKLMTVYR